MITSSKLVKLTLPGFSRVYPRTRLFNKLDELRQHPAVWLSAPGGAGKTTLVASYLQENDITPLWYQIDQGDSDIASFFYYLGEGLKQLNHSRKRVLPLLTPEYQFGLSTFSRIFFRKLFESMKTPGVLVLDNIEVVNDDVIFNDILQQGLKEIPPGCQVIVTGRALPPAQYAGLIAKEQLMQICWDELQVTEEESAGVISLLSDGVCISGKSISLLHKAAQGWVTGLVLLNQRHKLDNLSDAESIVAGGVTDGFSQQLFSDYFANEIFNRLPVETRALLLKTAWLSNMRVSTVKQLTGIQAAKKILSSLEQRQMFVASQGLLNPVYTYHPLLKDFLQTEAQEAFSQQDLNEFKNKAAGILAKEQDLDEAANLYHQTKNWPALERLILDHARMLSKQGRFRLLRSWLDLLPASRKEHNPWVIYWYGSAELMFDPQEAKGHFIGAYRLFETSSDASGTYLSWLGIMDSILFSNDTCKDVPKWIDELELVREKHSRYPSLEIKGRVTFAAFNLQLLACPQSVSFDAWRQKAERLQRFIPDAAIRCLTGSQLAMYYSFYAQSAKLKVLANSLYKLADSSKVMPLARILAYWVEITRRRVTGETTDTESIIKAAFKVCEQSGVHVGRLWLLSATIMYYLTKQNVPAAEKSLDQFHQHIERNHRSEQVHYHYLAGWLAYLKQDLELAHEHTEIAYKNILELHTPYFELLSRCAYSFVLIEMARFEEAKQHIEHARRLATEIKNSNMGVFYLGMLGAWMAYKQQQPEQVLPYLRVALACGREMKLVAVPWHIPAMLAPLCVVALENNIEVDYVQKFIRNNALEIPTEAFHLSSWPVPIRIYTLGRFGLLVNGRAVNQNDKSIKKPRELLRVLIAFGGREVNDSRIEDALWPDADGDAAHRSLVTNLQRLRKLLGIDNAIQYSDGRLTLDAHYCWVDAWAFERSLTATDSEQLEQILSLYKGNFLQGEGEPWWLLSTRERLRSKYLQNLEKLGQYLADHDQWQGLIDLYNRGLQIDDVHERLYQGLMHAHQQLGQASDAIRVYQQCQKKLKIELGVDPSRQTTTLFESLSR